MTLWKRIQRHLEPEYRDKTLREAIYMMIFRSDTRLGKGFDIALIFIILASIINVMLQSMLSFNSAHYKILRGLEYGFTAVFTVEYALRIYCSPKPKKYIFSFFGFIDLFAILPVYLNLFIPGSNYLVVMRSFRLIRVFRIFKLFRFLNQGDLLLHSIKESLPKIIVFFCFVVISVITIGTVMYVVEGTQPHTGFKNIPISVYWAIVTMTTVGYGDITPGTPLGQFLSALVMLIGYTIIAVPTGIVTASVVRHVASQHPEEDRRCANCGKNNHTAGAFYCQYCGSPLDDNQRVTVGKADSTKDA